MTSLINNSENENRGGRRAAWIIAIVVIAALSAWGAASIASGQVRRNQQNAHWNSDRQTLWNAYNSLSSAAGANDYTAYGLVYSVTSSVTYSLSNDIGKPSSQATQRRQWLGQARQCLPPNLGAFNARTPAAASNCMTVLQPAA